MKTIYTFLAILFLSCPLFANTVTMEEAQQVALKFYCHIASAERAGNTVGFISTYFHSGLVTFYIFHFHEGGFVIVAADDACIPVLGYSADNYFPPEITCPAVKGWLDDYSRQICRIVQAGISNRETCPQWEAILQGNIPPITRDVGPLLTTRWGQEHYYNELCPADPAGSFGHAPTGCGNTAMAQIMKYHNFPPHGIGSNSYLHPIYGLQSADFENTAYDWASMPDQLSQSNLAVATLMYHAGVSTNTGYTSQASAQFNPEISTALVDYFNYDPGIEWQYMSDYPNTDEWKDLIRFELDNSRPVFYYGHPMEEEELGHAFVCDGYQGDEFHFNYGWSGFHDGFYKIGKLTPAGLDFNTCNAIISNIKPYNPDLVVRFIRPETHTLLKPGESVMLEASTLVGNPDMMKITIDGSVLSTGNSNTLNYTWNPSEADCGTHDARAWAVAGEDTVWYAITLNVSGDFTKQSGEFEYLRQVNYLSIVDSNVVWAAASDGIWPDKIHCQDYTRTTDGGDTWMEGTIPGCEGLGFSTVFAISGLKAYIPMFRISGSNPIGIYVTSDGGTTWARQATASFSTPYSFPDCIHFFNEDDGWCMGDPIPKTGGGWKFEIYTTADGGENWTPVPPENIPPPLSNEYGMRTYSAVNDTLWFGTTQGRIYKSADRGYNWTVTEIPALADKYVTPVFRNGSHGLVHNLFGYTNEVRLFETFDGGATWSEIIPAGPLYNSDLDYVPGTLNTWVISGGYKDFMSGMSVSFDGCHTWTDIPGTRGMEFYRMAWLNERCGWIGSYNDDDFMGGIFKFTGNLGTPSAINDNDAGKNTFSVYPNPFNSKTNIGFSVPETGFASLSLYDISGKLVTRILSEKLAKGEHLFQWNAGQLKAGIYFIRLELDMMTQVKKVIVINNQ